jgi:UDP-4-amino-4,6-dideoxy-N-acetyl-beta-L-altrosamine transaminase
VIPYGRQWVDDDDIEAVVKVLQGDWLTQGPTVDQFEETIAQRVGARYAIAFANGTAALHAACAASELGPGDRVITSPLTFVASANCARYVGARVDFVDIDPATLNIDVEKVPAHADALVAVHFAGLPVDLTALPRRPRVVIEDAAHALGATTTDGPVGNCAHSDMTTFSFHPVKAITTAEGGAVTTNSSTLAERLRSFRSHGIVRKPERGEWYYEVESLGYNYRLSDIHAALGISQMGKLDRFLTRRNRLASRYYELLSGLPVTIAPDAPGGTVHGRHLFPIRVADRENVFARMRRSGIGVQVHYVPVTRHPTFGLSAEDQARFPEAERAYEHLISLPLYAGLTDDAQDYVVAMLKEALHS